MNQLDNNQLNIHTVNQFIGVVENRIDPLKLGRVQVRCFGYHTENKFDIPTEHLPWAQVCYKDSDNVNPPKDGEWVFGLFIDGDLAQLPVVIGVLPGISSKFADQMYGFCDQRKSNLQEYPNKIKSKEFKDDGTGITIVEDATKLFPTELFLPSTNELQRNETTPTIIQEKKDNVLTGIEIASTGERTTYDEPKTKYDAKYPFNKTYQSESGHAIEIDDTKGKERIHVYHRTGTFDEYFPDGNKVTKIVGDGFDITLKNKNVYVSGDCNLTTQGNINIYTKGNATINIDGDLNTIINGSQTETIYGDRNITIYGDDIVTINGTSKIESLERMDIIGNPLHFNA